MIPIRRLSFQPDNCNWSFKIHSMQTNMITMKTKLPQFSTWSCRASWSLASPSWASTCPLTPARRWPWAYSRWKIPTQPKNQICPWFLNQIGRVFSLTGHSGHHNPSLHDRLLDGDNFCVVVISQMLNLLFEPKCSPGDWGEYAANFRKAPLDRWEPCSPSNQCNGVTRLLSKQVFFLY